MEVLATNASISVNGQVLSTNTVNPLLQEVLVSQRKSTKRQMRFSNRTAGAKKHTKSVPFYAILLQTLLSEALEAIFEWGSALAVPATLVTPLTHLN